MSHLVSLRTLATVAMPALAASLLPLAALAQNPAPAHAPAEPPILLSPFMLSRINSVLAAFFEKNDHPGPQIVLRRPFPRDGGGSDRRRL